MAELFSRGVGLEEDPRNQLQAIATYERVLELDPQHAAAHINLGTLYYNRQDYSAAEDHYRRALAIDSRYAWRILTWKRSRRDRSCTRGHSDLPYRPATCANLRRRALQSCPRLREDQGATKSAQALASIRQARFHRTLVFTCTHANQAHPADRLAEAGTWRHRARSELNLPLAAQPLSR